MVRFVKVKDRRHRRDHVARCRGLGPVRRRRPAMMMVVVMVVVNLRRAQELVVLALLLRRVVLFPSEEEVCQRLFRRCVFATLPRHAPAGAARRHFGLSQPHAALAQVLDQAPVRLRRGGAPGRRGGCRSPPATFHD
jgi:hypothetical protein